MEKPGVSTSIPRVARRSGREVPGGNGHGAVTLKSLSEHLGLGITTVSDILLRGKTNYRAETVDRVRRAADVLQYRPNALAQGIRSGKTKTIGVLVTMNILDPFFAELVNRLEERFEAEGLMVLLSISDNDLARDRKVMQYFESRRVDGVVIGPVYFRESVIPVYDVYRSGLPSVMFLAGRDAPCDAVNLSGSVDGLPSHLVARHFLEMGHRRIGYLMCPLHGRLDVGHHSKRGFHAALAPVGCYEEKWIWEAPRPLADATYARMREILATHCLGDLPTAIYCHNDHCAVGAMAAIREAGLRVPDDISVVGTDNIVTSAFTDPPLTTVDLHASNLADCVFELMQQRLDRPTRRRRHIEKKAELILRKSVKRIGGPP
jgi:DNA-binding LacI/PurR family transcriptional regulator